MKKVLMAMAALGLAVSSGLNASPMYGYPMQKPPMPAVQEQQAGPDKVLREGMTKLLKFLRQPEKPDAQAIGGFLESEIAPYFDFDYMATWVAGPMNRGMSEQQHKEMAEQVKTMLLGTLTTRLGSYQNQDVRFYRPRRAGENEVKVRVGILQAGGYPANLDFRFYRGKDGWKVFDVSANGNSALAFYRQYFLNQMRANRPQGGYGYTR
ncbi:MAG: ABC transporter substrate-binding protein [Candidatus Thiodiazotropha sp.]